MKVSSLTNMVLLAISAISAATGNEWLFPIIIAGYVFLVIVLQGKLSDSEEKNAELALANTTLSARIGELLHWKREVYRSTHANKDEHTED